MDNPSQLINSDEFIGELKECAQMLSAKLSTDDFDGAKELIDKLVEVRDRNMFTMVGQLTRGLHNAIVNFNIDGDLTSIPPDVQSSGIQDATDRLNYVTTLTQNAAESTMDKVEASAPIAIGIGEEASQLQEEWHRLRRREMSADEFRDLYTRMDTFFEQMKDGSTQLNQNLQDIILEQGFQDLTGQVLSKVSGLVREVETSLVELVRIAAQVEEVTGFVESADTEVVEQVDKGSELEGPQINAEEREDVMSSQDDVDDLLSSLGF